MQIDSHNPIPTELKSRFKKGAALMAFGLLLFTLSTIVRSSITSNTMMLMSIATMAGGALMLSTWWRRYSGIRVEQRANSKLQGVLPADWRMEENYLSPAGGDIDVMIFAPTERRFAVEIKSLGSVKLKSQIFGVKESLTYRDGRALSRDPVAQCLRNAEATNAHPVLWLPRAPRAKVIHMKCGVVVVQGSASNLVSALQTH